MVKKILIVGYGTITKNIVKNILENYDIKISIWSRSKEFEQENCICSKNLNVLLQEVNLILSCVPDDEASYNVWNNDILCHYIKNNNVYCMEMSTLTYGYVCRWHNSIKEKGGKTIEAPLTNGRAITVGKSISVFLYSEFYNDEIEEFIMTFCNKKYLFDVCGEPMKFKLLYNTWGAEMIIQFAEMYKVISREITCKDTAWDILKNDGWMSSVCTSICSVLDNPYKNISFKLKYMKKDVDYAEKIFDGENDKLYSSTKQEFERIVNESNQDNDFLSFIDE